MSVESHELELYADNTSELHNQYKSIIANIKRRIENGTYDPARAPALWAYWFEAAAKRYVKEFGGDVRTMVPKSLRDQLSRERAKDVHAQILRGEYGAVTPGSRVKKSRRR